MVKRTLESELKGFRETLRRKLDNLSKDKEVLDITKADKEFLNMYKTAINKSLKYGTPIFKKAFESSLPGYNRIIDYKLDIISQIGRMR